MSMLLPPFELHEPTTIQEAARLRSQHPQSDFVAGGTDLLPNYKWMLNARPHVISLHRIQELRAFNAERIGALATLTQVARDAALWRAVPVLPYTASLIASPLLRNSGTIGGNLMLDNRCFFFNQSLPWRESIDFCLKADGKQCHVVPQENKCYATFSADLPGPLVALDAEYELVTDAGSRRVKAADFYHNDGIDRHAKRPGELLTFVHLPADASKFQSSYQKLRLRDSWDFPELGIAVSLKMKGENLDAFRLVANALEMAPKPLHQLGDAYLGRPLSDRAIEEISAAVEENVRPVKNTNLNPSYRKKMSRVFAARALKEARAGGTPRHLPLVSS